MEIALIRITTMRDFLTEESKNYDLIEGIYEELEILDKHFSSGRIEEWKSPYKNL